MNEEIFFGVLARRALKNGLHFEARPSTTSRHRVTVMLHDFPVDDHGRNVGHHAGAREVEYVEIDHAGNVRAFACHVFEELYRDVRGEWPAREPALTRGRF